MRKVKHRTVPVCLLVCRSIAHLVQIVLCHITHGSDCSHNEVEEEQRQTDHIQQEEEYGSYLHMRDSIREALLLGV